MKHVIVGISGASGTAIAAAVLERLKREEALDPERYRNSGMLLRLPNGLAVEPVLIRKKFLK